MDWHITLFAARWAMIVLFYFVLMVLLVGVYREASSRIHEKPAKEAISYGQLRVIHPGSDGRLAAGALLNLNPVTSLGAEKDNDIILGDRYVSGHHLRMRWDGAVWWVEDLNSKNGTTINRQPIEPGHPAVLPKGAVITAGDMLLEMIV